MTSKLQDLEYEIEVLKRKLDEKQAEYMGVTPIFTINADAVQSPEDFCKSITMWAFHRGNWQNFINNEELTPWIQMMKDQAITKEGTSSHE